MASTTSDSYFPCSLVINTPFPTTHHATTALRALQVDPELSPLVCRTFSLNSSHISEPNVLLTEYRATTNRMLRVAVNGFMESLGVILQIMEELDVDVLEQ